MTGDLAHCDHDWVDQPLRYEQATAMARSGDDPELREVPVTWVYDERCSKCGVERGWPT